MSDYSVKCRPTDFEDFFGNDELVKMLKRYLKDENRPRTYLFEGSYGCGKTTLARMMGSKLEVNSTEGKGSEFFFELSFLIPDKVEITDEIVLNPTEFKKLKNKNILIAEDNPLNQKLIAAILDQEQINYTIVGNGKETIEELEKKSFDMILMDGQMPVMDGLEATMIIRSSQKDYKDIPIVALTASALIGDKQKFLDAGMNDYISKPIDIVELFEKILYYTSGMKNKDQLKPINSSVNTPEPVKDDKFNILNLSDFEEKKKIFGKESYINILDMLLSDFKVKLDLIAQFLENNDLESLRHQTHTLKGIVTNFDTPQINNLCEELDKHALVGNIELIKATLDNIRIIAPQYKSEIIEYIKSL